jgi:hypothetical protein
MGRTEFGSQATAEAQGLVDVTLVCCRCGGSFWWTAGEQLFYQEKNLRAPRRCALCRRVNKIKPLAERL